MERTVAGFDTLINSEEYRVPAGLDAMHEIVLQVRHKSLLPCIFKV